jgi:hypothetical protein
LETILHKLKEACQEAKLQTKENAKLSDITLNTKTGEFNFIWKEEEK